MNPALKDRLNDTVTAFRAGLHVSNTVMKALLSDIHDAGMPDAGNPDVMTEEAAMPLAENPGREDSVKQYQTFVDDVWRARRTPDTDTLRNLFIMTAGIGGEAGEVQELLKKHVRDDVLDRDELILELGDVLYYLTRIASWFGSSLDEVMSRNTAKLIDRQKNGKRDSIPATKVDEKEIPQGALEEESRAAYPLYIEQYGDDNGWLGDRGSGFVHGMRAARNSLDKDTGPQHGDDAGNGMRYVLCKVGFGSSFRDYLMIPLPDGNYMPADLLQPFAMTILKDTLRIEE